MKTGRAESWAHCASLQFTIYLECVLIFFIVYKNKNQIFESQVVSHHLIVKTEVQVLLLWSCCVTSPDQILGQDIN